MAESFSALSSASIDYLSTSPGAHPVPEAVLSALLQVARLKCPFHIGFLLIVSICIDLY